LLLYKFVFFLIRLDLTRLLQVFGMRVTPDAVILAQELLDLLVEGHFFALENLDLTFECALNANEVSLRLVDQVHAFVVLLLLLFFFRLEF